MNSGTPHRTADVLQDLSTGLPQADGRFSAASLAGQHAGPNQDSYACRSPDFFALADGVGGGALGEVASAMLVRQLGELQAPHTAAVTDALQLADQLISERLQQEGQGPGAAVCAAVWLTDARTSTWLAMSVGDCKVMVARRKGSSWRIRWASPNQSYAHCDLAPPPGVSADAPANMVGCGMPLPAWFCSFTLARHERMVLCSDGFYNAFNEDELQDLLNQTPCPLDASSAQMWCERAKERGAQDDITVILVESLLPHADHSRWWWVGASVLALSLAFLSWAW
jgi:serine/threonine protein phosphatase PrpC